MTPYELEENLVKLDPGRMIQKALLAMQPMMSELNRKQMEKGVKATGEAITYQGRSKYSTGYAKKKGRSSPIDLKDTGSFHRKTYAEVLSDGIEFSSKDPKTKMLEERSGEDIFGLTTESKFVVQEQGMDIIITETETILRL